MVQTEVEARELDGRLHDGVDVRLLWDPRTNRVFVTVDDLRAGESFQFDVPAPDALEGFHHPFAYAAVAAAHPPARCFPATPDPRSPRGQ